jgi:hypothetical protein
LQPATSTNLPSTGASIAQSGGIEKAVGLPVGVHEGDYGGIFEAFVAINAALPFDWVVG